MNLIKITYFTCILGLLIFGILIVLSAQYEVSVFFLLYVCFDFMLDYIEGGVTYARLRRYNKHDNNTD